MAKESSGPMGAGRSGYDTTREPEKKARLLHLRSAVASLVGAGALSVGAINAAQAATIIISPGASLDGASPNGGNTWSLQGAASLSTSVALPTGTSGLTINGAPPVSIITLNNGGSYGHFSGNSATLNLSDVTFTGGNKTDGGAIIDIGSLTLNTGGSVTFSGNTATNQGGAIRANGGVTLGSVTLTNNTTTNYDGGAIFSDQAAVTVNDNLIATGNQAGANGGVMHGGGFTATGDVITLSGNTAVQNGGVINSIGSAGSVTLGNTGSTVTLTGNEAGMAGGAIRATQAVTVYGNLTASGNEAGSAGGVIQSEGSVTATGNSISLTNNTAGGAGGAIKATGSVTLGNTAGAVTLTGNTAADNGGAIRSDGSVTLNGDVTAELNHADGQGGVIDALTGVTLTGTTISFTGNEANSYGGALHTDGNVLINSSTSTVTLSGNEAGANGGAINAEGNVTINGALTATGNTAGSQGGAIKAAGFVTLGNATSTVRLENNTATNDSGGAIHADDGLMVYGNLTATGNAAGGNGGAILSDEDVVATGNNISLTGNTAGGAGGAVYAGGIVTLGTAGSTVTLSNNTATTAGGAIHADEDVTLNGNVAASHNEAVTSGGVIHADRDVALTGTSISLTDNTAGDNGGAINAGGSVTLGTATSASTVTLSNNKSTGVWSLARSIEGGAIRAAGDVTVYGALTADNNHTDQGIGGAIHASGNVTVTGDTSLTNNVAGMSGGAIHALGGITLGSVGSTLTFTNNSSGSDGGALQALDKVVLAGDVISLTNNTAAGYGGAIDASGTNPDSGNVTLGNAGSTVTLTGNTANYAGGAIRATQNVTVNGNLTTSGNEAGTAGGVIHSDGDVTASGNVISLTNNTADLYGGAISAVGNVTLGSATSALTLTGNTATNDNGGAIWAGGNVTLMGTTISNNSAAGDGGAIYTLGDFTLTATTEDLLSNNIAGGNGGAIWAGGNVTLNALNGGITFTGNTQGSGANAIWLDNTSGTSLLTLNAAGHPITFYDPLQNNVANGLLSVVVTGGNTVTFDGSRQSSAADRWSQVYGSTRVQNGTTLAVQNNAVYGVLAADVGQSTLSSFTVDSGATLAGGTLGTVRADNFTLGGTLDIAGTAAPGTASGGYSRFNVVSSNQSFVPGSLVQFNTYLNDASVQLTDLLTLDLDGGSSSGTSGVLVSNTGGLGDLTVGDGIELIEVSNGTSNVSFALAAPVQAGAYEYQLFKGGVDVDNDNWYLRSSIPAPDPTDPDTPIYRPGASGYVAGQSANMEQGITLLSTLHQRIGGLYDLKNDEHQSWSRLYGDNLRADGDRFNFKQRIVGIQLGHDLWVEGDGNGNTKRAGVVIDYAHGKADFSDELRLAEGFGSRHTGNLKSNTLSLGGYGTFSKDDGRYLDSVVMISRIRNGFTDVYDDHATQKAWRLGLSAEVGKPVAHLSENWQVEPQAQLSYQRTWYDSFHDDSSKVDSYQAESLKGRLGVRLFNDTVHPERQGKAYAVANIIHEFFDPERVDIGGVKLHEDYDQTFGELGLGGRFLAAENTTLFGDARLRRSFDGDSRGAVVNLGIQVQF